MRRQFLLLLMLLGFGYAEAQQVGGTRPEWVDGYFRDLPNSYIEVTKASGTDRAMARDRAARLVVERRNMASGGEYKVRVSGQTVEVTGDVTLTVKSRVLDEYAEHHGSGEWEVYLLVQTAKNPTYEYEQVSVTDHYPLSYKAFVPGMAQLDKKQTTKGVLFIAAEVACVGGIVAAEGLRTSYENKIASTPDASKRKDYINSANNCANVRNIMIGAAAAVYVWNIIDAVATKGPRRVKLGSVAMDFAPYATGQEAGLALNLHF